MQTALARLGPLGKSIPDRVKEIVTNIGGKLARVNAERRELAGTVDEQGQVIDDLLRKIPKVVSPGMEVGLVTGGGYGAGYLDELLTERKSERVGPVDTVGAVGFVGALAAVYLVKDADVATGVAAVLSGASAYSAGKAGAKKRREHAKAAAENKAKQAPQAAA